MKFPSLPSSSTLHNAVSKPSLKTIAPLAVAVASMSPAVLVGGAVAKEVVQNQSQIKSTLGNVATDAKKAGVTVATDTKKVGTTIAVDTSKVGGTVAKDAKKAGTAVASGMEHIVMMGGAVLVGIVVLKMML